MTNPITVEIPPAAAEAIACSIAQATGDFAQAVLEAAAPTMRQHWTEELLANLDTWTANNPPPAFEGYEARDIARFIRETLGSPEPAATEPAAPPVTGAILTPDRWCQLTGIHLIDRDGWGTFRNSNQTYPARDVTEPITHAEFNARATKCAQFIAELRPHTDDHEATP